ncbi:unnamed protein product [Brassicogethes aeneus]|uniref:Major facilitator superfamily (MFS) profile domain-containing protein n=1 Tax=Brassicogethes aeneus TaxID=1431903 RepID=A0A9P0FKX2_BRAAE|nr:unnamed protein product [Brassicogethes aeneus]
MAWLRGWTTVESVDPEFQELCRQLNKNAVQATPLTTISGKLNENVPMIKKPSKVQMLKLLGKKEFLWPYFLVALSFFLGHFNGMTAMQTYAIPIFSSLKAPIDKYYCTIILGAVEFFGCIACVTLVNLLGKRVINLVSLVVCGVCFITVATYAHVVGIEYLDTLMSPNVNETGVFYWTPLVFLVISSFSSYLGIKILPWILTGEVFPNETRAVASGLSSGLGYIFGFLANKVFFSMVSNLTLPGTFWVFGATSFIGAIILHFILPETEGKTLHEITEHFAGRSKLSNKVQRKTNVVSEGFKNEAFEAEESRF